MNSAITVSGRRRMAGFALMEILVAVLVLAIGLLGVASLQTNALKNNQSALQRSQATFFAYFMLDAMRANRSEATAGTYDLAKTCTAPTASTLITSDQNVWIGALKGSLGNADTTCGEISCDSTSCIVKVYWDDSRGLNGAAAQVLEIRSRL